nr:glycine receptor subunit alpha-2-like [Penaeus vannamei]
MKVGKVTLHYDNGGYYSEARVRLPLSRRYGYALLNIYIHSFILIVVSFSTLFFRTSMFEVRMMSALTAQLVIATLFSQVSASLPKSSYFKMVDIWLLFCIGITFLVIILHASSSRIHEVSFSTVTMVEPFRPTKSARPKQTKSDSRERRIVSASRWIVFILFSVFNLIYWGYILF